MTACARGLRWTSSGGGGEVLSFAWVGVCSGYGAASGNATAGSTGVTHSRDEEQGEEGSDDVDSRVRVPYFPVYSELRQLLRVWPGRPRKQVTGLRAALVDLRGTRQKAVDWTDPAKWSLRIRAVGQAIAGGDELPAGRRHGAIRRRRCRCRRRDRTRYYVGSIGRTGEAAPPRRAAQGPRRTPGSLYRFNAVRGTIVTTGRFARGAQNAAVAGGPLQSR